MLVISETPEVEIRLRLHAPEREEMSVSLSDRVFFMYKKAAFRLEKLCNSGSFMDRLDKLPRINF
jgi:hypothetical protein